MLEPISSAPTPDWMAGDEQLPWAWAVERLDAERNYWLVTARRDGFPQARPVWGMWSDVGLFLSIGHGGVQRTDQRPSMPVTVHTDDAVDVVIIEGFLDRVAPHVRGDTVSRATRQVDVDVRRTATERYNAKYEWNFELDGDDLNFLLQPTVAYGWRSTPTAVQAGTKWTFHAKAGE